MISFEIINILDIGIDTKLYSQVLDLIHLLT